MPTDGIAARRSFAETVVREARDLALEYFGDRGRLQTSMKGFQDFLTAADGAVEALIRARVAEAFPDDGFLGEEGGGGASDRLWIVDPIDGTANFARGEPYWCISIGFLSRSTPMIGVIDVPMLGETFAATRGGGAFRNGRQIRVADTPSFETASIEIGWSPRRPAEHYIELIREVMQRGASVKRSASGALGMCWTACGRTDAYLELHINSWDVAAGLVIAREAGAVVSDFFTAEGLTEGNPIVCATPAIAPVLLDLVGQRTKVLRPA